MKRIGTAVLLMVSVSLLLPASAMAGGIYNPPTYFPAPSNCPDDGTVCGCYRRCQCEYEADVSLCGASNPGSDDESVNSYFDCVDDAAGAKYTCGIPCDPSGAFNPVNMNQCNL